MARTAKIFFLLMVVILFVFSGCSDDDATTLPANQNPAGANKGGVPDEPGNDLPKTWTEIAHYEVDPYFTYQDLSPGCVEAPTGNGGVTDGEFSFFVKGGDVDNLVVYFQGGGACWSKTTCITAPTCTQEVTETVQDFVDMANGEVLNDDGNTIGGIFLDSDDNPFAGWSIVFIPYCTGDIHVGARDTDYAGPLGGPQVIQHRGAVNFQLVLKYMKTHFTKSPDKLFITGSSAGSYGAMMHFPHIKEAFPESDMSVIGDAGCGITKGDFKETINAMWNVQLPEEYIPEFKEKTFDEMPIKDIIAYSAIHYPDDRFAEYTTEADKVQVFFFGANDDHFPDLPDFPFLDPLGLLVYNQKFYDKSDTTLLDKLTNEWSTIMKGDLYFVDAIVAAEGPSNFKYYIGAGIRHTIMMYPDFYTEANADALDNSVTGKSFLEWVNEMIDPDFDWSASPSYVAP